MQLCSAIGTRRRLLFCVATLSILLFLLHCFLLLNSSNSTSSPTASEEPSVSNTTAVEIVDRINIDNNYNSCEPVLKVYMYDLPPEFHFGLLGWKGRRRNQTWPDVADAGRVPSYPGGLNLQHSAEYWLTLDLLLSNSPGCRPGRGGAALRVSDPGLADVVFVPFFASVSYNRHSGLRGKGEAGRDGALQRELVRFLRGREEWRRRGGRDHVVVAHHPNSMLEARRKLGPAVFVLADFGRYPAEIANLDKDVVAPYMHVVASVGEESKPFEGRPILVYFQGAIYRKDNGIIRQQLYQLLRDKKDVHFTYGSARGNGIRRAGQGMASSRFCLSIAGDTPSSNRLFDAIASHCVPVVVSDDIELPFEDVLDYSEFAVFVRAADAVREGFLLDLLRGISREEWTGMWRKLRSVAHHFEYRFPSREGDAVQMIWEAVARKLPPLRFKINKERRFLRNYR
ncbi:putative arabinosyltransferase ARAD1 [Iris pallida]|uniref:Arabinosyltransferase ARAD1 n=1 Tax=Iris pallida TaxID=29817 RepID=A0AAX6GT91_IRIPA|nr:putative arabinosyltransferase ARAD1 [Iris pallida]